MLFDTLYVNNKRATQARFPNKDTYPDFPSAQNPYLKSTSGTTDYIAARLSDLSQEVLDGIAHATARGDLDATVYLWSGNNRRNWMSDTIPFTSLDMETGRMEFKNVEGHPELYRSRYPIGGNARYFLQGNLGMLDEPGEYYFNKTTGDLYYYPDGAIEDQEIIIPCVKEVVHVEGASRDSMVSNIRFEGKVQGVVVQTKMFIPFSSLNITVMALSVLSW